MNPREDINQELQEMGSAMQKSFQQHPYAVPEGYFDGFEAELKAKLVTEYFPKAAPYQAPSGYFEQLRFTPSQEIKHEAKVIQMQPRNSVFRYAVAAVVTALLGLSLFNFMNSSGSSSVSDNQFASADASGASMGSADLDRALDELSDDDIASYLASAGTDVQAALVASVQQNGAELPNAEAYIFEDAALEDFLAEQNLMN